VKQLLWLCLLITTSAAGQNTLYAVIVDAQSNTPLPGAMAQISSLKRGASADANGLLRLDGIPNDEVEIEFRFIGYRTLEKEYAFPRQRADTVRIALSPAGEELGEITVSTTRSSRTISDIPTRIEVISAVAF
jgi:outer membrane receptor for ferrienterochelin and colicins